MGHIIATNLLAGDGHRNGMIKKHSQVHNPKIDRYVKRGVDTWQFMDIKSNDKPLDALESRSKMNNVNQFNPFCIDTSMAKKNDLKETLEFVIADSHIFAIEEVCYTITDDSNKYKPNWKLLDIFGDGSLCQKVYTSNLDIKKIYNRYKDLLENNELCEQCKKVLIEYFNI